MKHKLFSLWPYPLISLGPVIIPSWNKYPAFFVAAAEMTSPIIKNRALWRNCTIARGKQSPQMMPVSDSSHNRCLAKPGIGL